MEKQKVSLEKTVIYDIEIINPIKPKKDSDRVAGITYCESWKDFENMGIAVICCYDFETDQYRVFQKDNLNKFSELLIKFKKVLLGYNNFAFDNHLLKANNLFIPNTYDLLSAIWVSKGIGKDFVYPASLGVGLDAMDKANGGMGKPRDMDGLTAAIGWQQGKFGEVIDYCLNDVYMTKRLLERSLEEPLILPTGDFLEVNVFDPKPDQLFLGLSDEPF